MKLIKDLDATSVVVEGYTDANGNESANAKLSRERAQTIKDYFLSVSAISPDKVKAIGYGELYPVATNTTPQGRMQNRRIDILLGF